MEPQVNEFERALARRLWEAGVPEGPLQALLAEVEGRADLSLAAAVVTRGLASVELVERSLHEVGAAPQTQLQTHDTPLADYEITGVLGQGGMGVVHAIRHRTTGVQYALKRTLPAADPQEHTRLIREAELLARLDHPGLVRVHSADFSGAAPAFVLEFLEGGSLQDRLRAGPLSPPEAKRVMAQIAAAVGYLHREGVLHRDLKPLNVLFDGQGNARLTDFGLARARGAMTLTQTGELLGTPGYMAPEQILDPRRVDARSDVYALGALLFALLSGRPPFQAGTALATLDQVLHRPPPTLQSSRGDSDAAAYEELCARALAKDPAERPQTAEAFAAALERGSAVAPARRLLPLAVAGGVIALALLGAKLLDPEVGPSPSLAAPSPSLAATRTRETPKTSPSAAVDDAFGPVPVDLEKLELLANQPHGFERLRAIVQREQPLLEKLYPDMACARRDVALIAALGAGEPLERWFGGSKRGGTPREKRARRWYRVSTRGERRALRNFAHDGRPKPEKRHLLWLAALSGGESGWVDLINHNRLADDGLELAKAQSVFLKALGGRPPPLTPEQRQVMPSRREARALLRGVLGSLRQGPPQPRAEWDLGTLSPRTAERRINAVLERLIKSEGAEWLAASRSQALAVALTRTRRGHKKRAALFESAQRSQSLDSYLASALRGSSCGLGRFVRLAIGQAAISEPKRERAQQALVLAVVAFDSPLDDPAPLTLEVAGSDRFLNLRSVLRALKLVEEAAALVVIQRSLGYSLGGQKSFERASAGGGVLQTPEEAWGVVEPLLEACLAVERGEAELSALAPLVPR